MLGVCADYEWCLNAGAEPDHWIDLAYFLIDTAAGMLTAPVTRPQESRPCR